MTTLTVADGRYKNLDGLRGIAALAVVMGHIERYKPAYGFQQLPLPFLPSLGAVSVTVFFVLSGFVITNLLLNEKLHKGRINVRHFYARRILRIFPLYFLVLLSGYFLSENMPAKGIVLSAFFLSNLAFLKNLLPPVLYPVWTIGVEEQFYAVHPFIMRFIGHQKLPFLFGLVILIEIFLRNLYLLPVFKMHTFYYSLHNFLLFTRFDTILMGCMAAIYFNRLNHTMAGEWIFSKAMQCTALLLFFLLLYLTVTFDIIWHELYAVLAACIIINLCRPQTSIVSLSCKPLLFLGKISYGIYMLHKFSLYAVLYCASKMNMGNMLIQNIFLYTVVTGTGVLSAWISYTFFESYFLYRK